MQIYLLHQRFPFHGVMLLARWFILVVTQLAFLSKICLASLAISDCLARNNADSANLCTRTETRFKAISKITSNRWHLSDWQW